MAIIKLFLLLLLTFVLLLLLIGLIKPTIAVWWEDVQNRRRVIKIYGRIAFGLILLYIALELAG